MAGRTAYIQGLRDVADWLEDNPECPGRIHDAQILNLFVADERELRAAARALGTFEKRVDNTLLILRKEFPSGAKIDVCILREKVCRKVTKTIETEVWECPESLLEPTADVVAEVPVSQ